MHARTGSLNFYLITAPRRDIQKHRLTSHVHVSLLNKGTTELNSQVVVTLTPSELILASELYSSVHSSQGNARATDTNHQANKNRNKNMGNQPSSGDGGGGKKMGGFMRTTGMLGLSKAELDERCRPSGYVPSVFA